MRIKFDEIAVKGTRRWVEDGKKRQETKKFWQTVNPFNKNAEGLPKTPEEIYSEIKAELKSWMSESIPK